METREASLKRRAGETLTTEPLHVRRYEAGDKDAVRRLHDDALNEVYTTGAVTTPSATVPREALPSVASGQSVTWRVCALRGGDIVSTSPPASLTLP